MASYVSPFTPSKPSNLRSLASPPSPTTILPIAPPSPIQCPSLTSSPSPSPEATPSSPISVTSLDSLDSLFGPYPPPPSPAPWTWFCHMCKGRWPLGVTRRCLNDGHRLCFGNYTKLNRRTGRIKRHRACDTEFDYDGWRTWNNWRSHRQSHRRAAARGRGDCSLTCDFPNECTHAVNVLVPLERHATIRNPSYIPGLGFGLSPAADPQPQGHYPTSLTTFDQQHQDQPLAQAWTPQPEQNEWSGGFRYVMLGGYVPFPPPDP